MMKTKDIINKIICGDSLLELKKIESESIDMCITSPPYYGLRDYNVDGQLGLENSFEEYLEKLLEIIAEIKRVLKKEGSFWLNMGDCYGGLSAGNKSISEANIGTDSVYVRKMKQCQGAKSFVYANDNERMYSGKSNKSRLKHIATSKCLLMQPERLAIRMIDEQRWILRNKIKWSKQVLIKKENKTIGSVMPTSVKDRFNESGEELYFFVKSKKYYFDLDAVRLPNQVLGVTDMRDSRFVRTTELYPNSKYRKYNHESFGSPRARTQRNWRQEESEGYKMGSVDSHRAALRGGLKNYQKNKIKYDITKRQKELEKKGGLPTNQRVQGFYDTFGGKTNPVGKNIPTIWQINPEPHKFEKELEIEGVEHFATFPQSLLEIPIKFGCPKDGIVLDPFMGSGTTALVSKKLGRNYIGIELNNEYVKLAESRIDAIPQSLFD